MSVTPDDVRAIARLARLRIPEEEQVRFAADLSRILEYVEQLSVLDTEDVPPMAHALDLHTVVRPDAIEQRISRDEALAEAPSTDGRYFRVPKVID